MTLLLLFLSLFIGISIRASLISGIIELLILLIFSYFRIKKKKVILLFLFVSLVGVGLSFIRPSFTKERYQAMVVEVKENYYIVSSSLEKMYISEKNNEREVGDILIIQGDKKELDFVTLESEFDFKEYLNNKGVYSELVVTNLEVKFSNPIKIHHLKKNFLEKFDDNSKGIVSALLFGSGSKGELNELNRDLHLMRLISSSGIYLYFLYKVFRFFLLKIIKKEKIVDLISIILFIPYLLFSFPKFVVMKFIFLRSLMWINEYLLNKRFKYLELISISGIVFLILDYHYAYQDGFFLAYFIPIILLLFNGSFRFKKKWISRLLGSLIIYISFIPFEAKFYNEISILSLPLQIILSPFYIILFLSSLITFIGIPLYSVVSFEVNALSKILKAFQIISVEIYIPKTNPLSILIFEVVFMMLLYYSSIRLKPMKDVFIVAFIGTLGVYLFPLKAIIRDYVSFINVGQGDSTLIKYKNSTILIDTGGNKYKDIAKEVLIPYFKNQQIYRIDMLITTHDDFDHSGAVTSLVNNFNVRNYVKDYQSFPLNVNGLEIKNYNVYPELWNGENDKSLVLGFKINNYNYLVMGDAPKKIENEIVKNNTYIPCDILKVGHHGSKTSTGDNFIKYLRPKVAVISCGKNNMYGHPHESVLAILRRYEVVIRRTDLESTITF